jgi:hypothetical protein
LFKNGVLEPIYFQAFGRNTPFSNSIPFIKELDKEV